MTNRLSGSFTFRWLWSHERGNELQNREQLKQEKGKAMFKNECFFFLAAYLVLMVIKMMSYKIDRQQKHRYTRDRYSPEHNKNKDESTKENKTTKGK